MRTLAAGMWRRFLTAGLGIAHLGEDDGNVALLKLPGAVAGQELVEVLPGAAERLPQSPGFRLQPLRHAVQSSRWSNW